MNIQSIGMVLFMLLSLNMSAQSSVEDLKGTWKGWDKLIKIYEDNNGLQGIYVNESGRQSQKERVLRDLVFKNEKWFGKIFSKKRGKTTKTKFTLISPGKLKVKLIIGLFSKSFTWKKID